MKGDIPNKIAADVVVIGGGPAGIWMNFSTASTA